MIRIGHPHLMAYTSLVQAFGAKRMVDEAESSSPRAARRGRRASRRATAPSSRRRADVLGYGLTPSLGCFNAVIRALADTAPSSP